MNISARWHSDSPQGNQLWYWDVDVQHPKLDWKLSITLPKPRKRKCWSRGAKHWPYTCKTHSPFAVRDSISVRGLMNPSRCQNSKLHLVVVNILARWEDMTACKGLVVMVLHHVIDGLPADVTEQTHFPCSLWIFSVEQCDAMLLLGLLWSASGYRDRPQRIQSWHRGVDAQHPKADWKPSITLLIHGQKCSKPNQKFAGWKPERNCWSLQNYVGDGIGSTDGSPTLHLLSDRYSIYLRWLMNSSRFHEHETATCYGEYLAEVRGIDSLQAVRLLWLRGI